MSQEHRFCAEIYARLFSLLDHSKRVVVNPDGEARLPDFEESEVPPDLCFTLYGQRNELRIEAKILKGKSIKLQDTQKIWCREDDHPLAPHLWIVSDRELGQCWLFEHDDISQRIRAKVGESAPLNLWPNATPPDGCHVTQLALQILQWALTNLDETLDIE